MIAIAGLAGACGSSSTAHDTTTQSRASTTSEPTPSTSTTVAKPTTTVAASDTAAAARAALNERDLPGYTAVAVGEPTAATVAQNRAFARCVGADPSLVDVVTPPGEVRRLFVKGDIHVVNTVHLFTSAADAATRFAVYTRPATGSCLGTLFASTLRAQAAQQHITIGGVGATTLPVRLDADHSVAYRLTAPLDTPTAQVNEYVDLVAVLRGRATVILEASTSGQPYGTTADVALTNKVLARLASR